MLLALVSIYSLSIPYLKSTGKGSLRYVHGAAALFRQTCQYMQHGQVVGMFLLTTTAAGALQLLSDAFCVPKRASGPKRSRTVFLSQRRNRRWLCRTSFLRRFAQGSVQASRSPSIRAPGLGPRERCDTFATQHGFHLSAAVCTR